MNGATTLSNADYIRLRTFIRDNNITECESVQYKEMLPFEHTAFDSYQAMGSIFAQNKEAMKLVIPVDKLTVIIKSWETHNVHHMSPQVREAYEHFLVMRSMMDNYYYDHS